MPTTTLEIPEKGVYEPPATLKQKNLLMKMGCNRFDNGDCRSFAIDNAKCRENYFGCGTVARICFELSSTITHCPVNGGIGLIG